MFGILVFGNSITFGSGVAPGNGWADKLKFYFEPKGTHNVLYNLGIPGNSSTELLARIQNELGTRIQYIFPDNKFIVLIAIGTNDSRGLGNPENIQTKPEKYKDNVERIVNLVKSHTKHVVLINIPPVDESIMPFEDTYFNNTIIEKFNEILVGIAKHENVLYCDIYTKFFRKNHKKLLVDGLHPNDEGHKLIYATIKNFLIEKKLIS